MIECMNDSKCSLTSVRIPFIVLPIEPSLVVIVSRWIYGRIRLSVSLIVVCIVDVIMKMRLIVVK